MGGPLDKMDLLSLGSFCLMSPRSHAVFLHWLTKFNGPFSFYFAPCSVVEIFGINDTWNSIFSNLAYISLRLNRQNQSDTNRELDEKRGLNIGLVFFHERFYSNNRRVTNV